MFVRLPALFLRSHDDGDAKIFFVASATTPT